MECVKVMDKVIVEKYKDRNIGQRIKERAKLKHKSNKDIANCLNKHEKTVSAIYGGKAPLYDEDIESLSKLLETRAEYLKNEDNFATEEDFLRFSQLSNIEDFMKCIEYLKTLGFTISPFIKIKIPINTLNEYWDQLKKYIHNSSLKQLEKGEYVYSNEEYSNALYKKYFGKEIVIRLKQPIDDIGLDDDFFINPQKNTDIHIFTRSEKLRNMNTVYFVGYEIYYKHELISICSAKDLYHFKNNILDAFIRCTIENAFPRKKYSFANDIETK